jgi:hypothetical protein
VELLPVVHCVGGSSSAQVHSVPDVAGSSALQPGPMSLSTKPRQQKVQNMRILPKLLTS